jgi:hypothetical protein
MDQSWSSIQEECHEELHDERCEVRYALSEAAADLEPAQC